MTHDLSSVAAEFAYHVFLALFPFFIFVGGVGGFVADLFGVANPTEEIMNVMGKSLPPDSASVFRTQLEGVISSRNVGLVSASIAGSLWVSAGGIATLMKGMNRIYEVRETRPWWRRSLLALAITVLGGVSLVLAFSLLILARFYGLEVAEWLGLAGTAARAFALALWPVIALFVLLTFTYIYWFTPNVDLTVRSLLPGSLLFTIAWLIFTLLFSFYVGNFGSYNATYGTLGTVIVVLVWLYLSSYLIFLGAEVNASLARRSHGSSTAVTAFRSSET